MEHRGSWNSTAYGARYHRHGAVHEIAGS